MSNTKELRGRIRSIKNTSKITKAMELVSAAKMRRAQNQALAGRTYSTVINQILRDISGKIDPSSHPLLIREPKPSEDENPRTTAVLLITTDRGLCGSLNTNLFRKLLDIAGPVKFITIGKKGSIFVTKTARTLEADFELIEKPSIEFARKISRFLINSYLEGHFTKIHVVYTDFQSTLKQSAVMKQLLPIINLEVFEQVEKEFEKDTSEFKFEPNPKAVLETILPHYVQMEVYQLLLEASASEHSARMVAMKNASDNAGELVNELTLIYNQLRQEAITNEILDISTAQVALS